jgi:hypothetical protein
MAKGKPKPKELKPWDRRPWPSQGDTSQEALYAGIGRALSEWERYEAVLSFLFSSFVSPSDPAIARRAYSAVRTFEGRTEMLRAASEAHFWAYPNHDFLASFKIVLQGATTFSPRRNDIAHGAVDHYRPPPPALRDVPAPNTFALFPSFASFRERDINNAPLYCYTSPELEYFRQQFFILRRPAGDLAAELQTAERKRASHGKLRQLYRTSTNQGIGQTAQLEDDLPPEPSQE